MNYNYIKVIFVSFHFQKHISVLIVVMLHLLCPFDGRKEYLNMTTFSSLQRVFFPSAKALSLLK
jgi:hypothetical protein